MQPNLPFDNLVTTVLTLILAFLLFLVPLVLIVLANLGERYPTARILTIILDVLACLLLVACGPLTALSAISSANAPNAAASLGVPPLVLALMGLVMVGTGLLAMLPLIPIVRRGLAYVLPINPQSLVHGVALSLALLVIGVSVAQLPLAMSLANPNPNQQAALESFNSLPLLWLQGFMFVLYGFFGVGWTIRRGWRDTLARLRLGRLTPAYLSIAIGAWLGLLLLDFLVSLVWKTVLPSGYEQFGRLTESLFGSFISIPGALTIGLSAGIGEEILFRGALQPRLGLPLTSLLFMIVHAQYGFTPALVQIFVVAIVLGLIRRYANTTTCIVVHTLFNATGILLALYFPNWV